jgi:hypothetical protein
MFRSWKVIVDRRLGCWLGEVRPRQGWRPVRPQRQCRPALLALEDRLVPSAAVAPVVHSTTASGPTANSLSAIRVTFSQPIVPATFTATDLSLLGPAGRVAIGSVSPVAGTNDTAYSVAFATQTTPGAYTLYIGSNAKDAAGVALTLTHAAFKITAPAVTTPAPKPTTPTAAPTPTPAPTPAPAPAPTGPQSVNAPGTLANFMGTLTPGQSLSSPNGQYYLIMQTDGNLVVYATGGKPVWSSGTNGKGVTQMVMQTDGNLVLYRGSTPVWASNTPGNGGGVLNVLNNGMLSISREGMPIWGSAGLAALPPFTMVPGQSVTSPAGLYTLTLQTDGNLVERNASGTIFWTSGTNGLGVTQAVMQGDGNLVIYAGSKAVWSSGTPGNAGATLAVGDNGTVAVVSGTAQLWSAPIQLQNNAALLPGQSLSSPNGTYFLIMQTDGNLVEYNTSGSVFWSSGTNGKGVTQMVMQSDGNLVLYKGSTVVWASNTQGHAGGVLSVGDNGAVEITVGSSVVWTA